MNPPTSRSGPLDGWRAGRDVDAPRTAVPASAGGGFGAQVQAARVGRGYDLGQVARPYSAAYLSLVEAGVITPSQRAVESILGRLAQDPERRRAAPEPAISPSVPPSAGLEFAVRPVLAGRPRHRWR
jgi:hypothetical protein